MHEFGWLRAAELGAFMWPANATSAEAANRMIRSWVVRKLVLVRELPDRAGKATVLALAGVQLLAAHGYTAHSGKDIGTLSGSQWMPPKSWRHDLMAAGVLAHLFKRGCKVIPEQSLRREPTQSPKLPDGLICTPSGHWIWLEVENAVKTGKNMQMLGKALALAAIGRAHSVGGQHCSVALVAYTDTKDTRGHNLNHKARVMKAISEQTKRPIEVLFAHCTMAGASVTSVTITPEKIESEQELKVLRVMNKRGWEIDPETGCLTTIYGRYSAYIWEGDGGYWWVQIDEREATPYDTLTKAKRGAATEIHTLSTPS